MRIFGVRRKPPPIRMIQRSRTWYDPERAWRRLIYRRGTDELGEASQVPPPPKQNPSTRPPEQRHQL